MKNKLKSLWEQKWEQIISAAFLMALLAVFIIFLQAYMQGNFKSIDSFRDYINGFGIMAPTIFTTFQMLQVIFPVLPGFIGCAAGAVMFGAGGGFLYNYLGISVGSIIAFFLARQYGTGLVKTLFSSPKYEKWSELLGKSRYYTLLLFASILLPLLPDDFLCYFSGLTTMNAKKFIWIIVLGKPWCILAYSLVFSGALMPL